MSGGGAQNPKKKQEKFKIDKKNAAETGAIRSTERKKKTRKVESEDKRENRDLYLPSSLCICINRDNCEGVAGGVESGEARVSPFFLCQSPDAIKWWFDGQLD